MSLMENIATLTGTLKFLVDMSGLNKFQAALKRTESQMRQLEKQASVLQAKLNKSFGITGHGASTAKLKADAAVNKALDKELQTSTKLSRLQRQQYQTALAEQKLVFTGERNAGLLQTDKLKMQSALAVASAKQYKAQQESLKVDLGRAKLQGTVEQSKIREAKLADILHRRQAATARLQQDQVRHASALQRMEIGLNNARAAGVRAAEKHATSKLAHAAREARATIRTEQAAQRFSMQQDRFQAWKIKQAEPVDGVGMGGLAIGVSGVGAAVFALTSAIGALGQRIEQRQAGVVSAEGFNTALETAGGKNPENQKRARDAYLDVSDKYGIEISVESSKDYAKFVQGQVAMGKTLSQAIQMFEGQSATFRAAALNAEAQKRAAYQLSQIRAKGRPEGADVNDLFDALGAPVNTEIRKAAAERVGFKGKTEELVGWFKQAVTDGKIKAEDFDKGMSNYLAANQDVLAKQMSSVAAAQQRSDNQTFLNESEINSSQELKGVILERIEAEKQLNEAMQPLKETLAGFDVGLTKLATSMLRLTAGKNADDTEKTDKQRAQEVGSAGFPEGIAIDPSVMGGGPKPSTGKDVQDPISRLFRYLTGTPDYENGPAKDVEVKPINIAGLRLPKLDLSKFGVDPENLADGLYRQFRVPDMFNAEDAMRRATQFQPSYPAQPPVQQKETPAPNVINSNNTTTVQPANVSITINAESADAEEVGRIVDERVRDAWSKSWREADAANGSEVY